METYLAADLFLAIKEFGTENESPKARYVVQGHRGREKAFLVHSTMTMRERSLRLIISFAAVKTYRIFSHGVKQAYLQSDEELSRKIYVKPKQQDLEFFDINEDDALDLRKPLYGSGHRRDCWGITFDRHAQEDLHLTPTDSDPSLYLPSNDGDDGNVADQAEGCMGNYVEDELLAGNEAFQELTKAILERIESSERSCDNFTFSAVISRHSQRERLPLAKMIKFRSLPSYLKNVYSRCTAVVGQK